MLPWLRVLMTLRSILFLFWTDVDGSFTKRFIIWAKKKRALFLEANEQWLIIVYVYVYNDIQIGDYCLYTNDFCCFLVCKIRRNDLLSSVFRKHFTSFRFLPKTKKFIKFNLWGMSSNTSNIKKSIATNE